MTADALFRIASMTKAITSTAAMQLIEQGRFGLDDPVEKYLPAFARLQVFESFDGATGTYRLRPATRIATVRHLMTHTSGLGYGFTSATVRDFKPRAGEDYPVGPLLFEPGERWLYGTSTDWLGRLVEAVSGRPLDEYFRLRILEPLGMADTFYNVPADKQARLVAVHHRGADGTIVKDATQPAPTVNPIIGGGGLSSTASDYIRFVRMILNDGAARRRPHPEGRHGRGDEPQPDRHHRRSRPQDGAAGTQRRFQLRRRRPRQMGTGIPDHRRPGRPASARPAA